MVKLSTLKYIGIDNWNRPVFKSETSSYYCSVDTLVDHDDPDIENTINAVLLRVAKGVESLYSKGSFDGEPGYPISFDVPLTSGQMQDLFEYIVTNGECTESSALPNIAIGAIPFEYSTGGIDSYTIYLKDGLPVAASDDLVGIHWVL